MGVVVVDMSVPFASARKWIIVFAQRLVYGRFTSVRVFGVGDGCKQREVKLAEDNAGITYDQRNNNDAILATKRSFAAPHGHLPHHTQFR